jgi:hypothetical protein
MFKWFVLAIFILATMECISRILYNCFLEMIDLNKMIAGRIGHYTQRITETSNEITRGEFNSDDLMLKVVMPTLVQIRYMNFLERQNHLHWRVQALWIIRMFFMSTIERGIYLRGLMRKYGKPHKHTRSPG